jgi:hypothetical protein
MTPREAKYLDGCYTLLTEQYEEKGYAARQTLTRLLAKIIVRNVRTGQAGGAK